MVFELKDIKKYFVVKKGFFGSQQKYIKAVDGVDLSILQGENVGLVGESGSGKTTLGRIILKLYAVDSGSIYFTGRNITNFSTSQMRPLRKNIQMVFQDPYSSLDPRFTVKSLFKEALSLEGLHRDSGEQEKRMTEVLQSVGLPTDSLYRFPHEFSGGERQRIAIARALIVNPQLLVLDEAVSSLDVLIQEHIISLLRDLQEKYEVTYLFISHNLRVVKKVCTKIAVMYKGKIVEVAQTEELFKNPIHPYTKALLSAAIDYKTQPQALSFDLGENSNLIDRGDGHFVLN